MNQTINNTKGYNGNILLKRANQQIEWTEDLVQEWVKCAEDPLYFIKTYMKIITLNEGLQTYQPWPYQEEMIKKFVDNRYTIVTTARQAGKSTTTCAFILWYIIFQADKTVALLANKGETAREILGRVQLAYQHLPRWLQQGVKEWNKGVDMLRIEYSEKVIIKICHAIKPN